MTDTAFYDANIFVLCGNTDDSDCATCSKLTDVGVINWPVVVSYISREETNVAEFIDAFISACILNGVDIYEVGASESKEGKRLNKPLLRKLAKLGLSSRDQTQLAGAIVGQATILVSRDEDFFDPANKRTKKGSKSRSTKVAKLIKKSTGVCPVTPGEAVDLLL